MILLLDTSTPVCRIGLRENNLTTWHEWEAGRQLAKDLLRHCVDMLADHQRTLGDLTGVGVFRGPGSFTGLRIGLTVANTMADGLTVPIVGGLGNDWEAETIAALQAGKNHHIVLPEYGSEAHITKPRK